MKLFLLACLFTVVVWGQEDDADKVSEATQKLYNDLCPEKKEDCRDENSFCPNWATYEKSECTENPDYMAKNCQKSCCPICTGANLIGQVTCPTKENNDQCSDNSKNPAHSCVKWAENGECDKNKKWMLKNCMRSCCDECKVLENGCPAFKGGDCSNTYDDEDADAKCAKWQKAGECTKNPKWMLANCQKECCPTCMPEPPARTTTTVVRNSPARTTTNVVRNWGYPQVRYAQQPVSTGATTRPLAGNWGSYGALPYMGR
jgi:hypothetical protein